jgi:hypothetical protein
MNPRAHVSGRSGDGSEANARASGSGSGDPARQPQTPEIACSRKLASPIKPAAGNVKQEFSRQRISVQIDHVFPHPALVSS